MFGRIAIIGSGAIGLYYGGRLAQHDHDVTFLMRSDAHAAKNKGIVIRSVNGDAFLPAPQIAESADEIGPVDLIIIAWKTTSNHHLASVLPPLLHPATHIITLQNGIGNCEKIAAFVEKDRIMAGLCSIAINRTAPAEVHHSAGGRITVAEYAKGTDKRLESLLALFSNSQIDAATEPCLETAIWKKLLWNVPFNGLSIVAGQTTDKLLATPNTLDRIRTLMEEVWAIATARGCHLEKSLIDWNIQRTYNIGPYRPSSMIDWQQGRPVEIDSLWGEPLRIGIELRIPLPELSRLHQEILAHCHP